MLYLVAIAYCLNGTPVDECDHVYARKVDRHWIYRSDIDGCLSTARDVADREFIRDNDVYPKVFCIRAETFNKAHSEVLTLDQ